MVWGICLQGNDGIRLRLNNLPLLGSDISKAAGTCSYYISTLFVFLFERKTFNLVDEWSHCRREGYCGQSLNRIISYAVINTADTSLYNNISHHIFRKFTIYNVTVFHHWNWISKQLNSKAANSTRLQLSKRASIMKIHVITI